MKRIVGIGVARIRGKGGTHALRVHNSTMPPAKETLTLTPFSSALRVSPDGVEALKDLGVSHLQAGDNLDCSVADTRVDAFEEWFYARTGRDTLMLPGLLNMFVGLKILRNSDREGNSEKYDYSASHTTRMAIEGPVIYFIDLFDVRLAAAGRMRRQGHLYYATKDELRACKTRRDALISTMAGAIFL